MNERRKPMKRLSIICAILAATLAVGSQSVRAEGAGDSPKGMAGKKMHEGHGPADDMGKGEHLALIAKVLRLNDSQQEKFREMMKTDHEENRALMNQLAENRKLFHQKSNAADFNEAEVRAITEKQGQLMAKMMVSPAIMRNKFRALLTPEQRDLEERIQPLLEHVPGHGAHFGGMESPSCMGHEMEHHQHLQGEESHPCMGKEPNEKHPCCDED
jgi:Spy/CpxP family protein refolding chaperone